ncbi:hypothetical protein [Lactiplantibacillus pentosus]|uniref:hypothetical protein n=1 Tax=Lactiplantibacillus pentosus TaxID=1589 RepID=UPI0021A44796|nr:hypothetical protein [Lactiplantibacillus pentosus]
MVDSADWSVSKLNCGSACPGGAPGLEEDSYLNLRSELLREFKSRSALFQRCQPASEVGIGRASTDEQQSNSGYFPAGLSWLFLKIGAFIHISRPINQHDT